LGHQACAGGGKRDTHDREEMIIPSVNSSRFPFCDAPAPLPIYEPVIKTTLDADTESIRAPGILIAKT
jgi:hypothetical protein